MPKDVIWANIDVRSFHVLSKKLKTNYFAGRNIYDPFPVPDLLAFERWDCHCLVFPHHLRGTAKQCQSTLQSYQVRKKQLSIPLINFIFFSPQN